MLKSIIATIFTVFLLVSLTGQSANAPTFLVQSNLRVRIQLPTNHEQIKNFARFLTQNEFDIAGINQNTNTLDLITDSKGVEFLKSKGVQGTLVGGQIEAAPDKRYLNPTSLQERLVALSQINPKISKLVELGKSNQGRPMMAMLISSTLDVNDPAYHAKPTIIFDGLHHAREIMTPEIVVDVADTLLKNPNDPAVQNILQNWNVWLLPMMNPDGSNIVWTSNNMWRKNAKADSANVYGVDINRNYGYRWGECGGSSNSKSSDIYRGAVANSEPETQAIEKLGEAVRPVASLSYHSFSEFVLYPFGCDNDLTNENAMIQKIAKELASVLPLDSGRGTYKPGTPWQLLYSVDGSSMDYFYAAFGTLAYTFEVNEDFQPPYSLRDATVAKHRKAWMYFISRAQNNLIAVDVVDSKTGKPSEAMIAINTISHTKKELPFKTNKAGRFFKVLEPGQYKVAAKLADGRTAEIAITMTGKPQLAKLVVQ